MRLFSRNAVRWLSAALVGAALPVASAAQARAQAPPPPDAVTVSANQDVTLCRPRGRCFIPEADDPIFVGDVIETFDNGWIELRVPGVARVVLAGPGRLRVAGGPRRTVEIALLAGRIGVEASPGRQVEVTFGRTRCRLGAGPIAVAHRGGPSSGGMSTVANGGGDARCDLPRGGAAEVGRGTLAEIRGGRVAAWRPVPDGTWSFLAQRP